MTNKESLAKLKTLWEDVRMIGGYESVEVLEDGWTLKITAISMEHNEVGSVYLNINPHQTVPSHLVDSPPPSGP